MGNDLNEVVLSRLSPLIASVFFADTNAVMVAKFGGKYRHGSQGNSDGLFMAATLAAHVAVLEPVCLVLDLLDLEYEWGNTILKAINFFDEYGRDKEERNKSVIVVATGATRQSLAGLERDIKSGKRLYCDSLSEAFIVAEREAKSYLA